MPRRAWWFLALCVWCMPGAEGHGRMLVPPSRPSAWRLGFDAPVNYDDNQQNCGGRMVQRQYGYKCGICGDPWLPTPRPYERPDGAMVVRDNYILSTYKAGRTITVSIQITAPHLGYFEFFLCNVDELYNEVEATPECLQKHPLPIGTDGTQTRYTHVYRGVHEISLQLPPSLVCHHCVLQWKYRAGNDWSNGCKGCGPQEEFYSCADISITYPDGTLPPTTPKPPTPHTTLDPFGFVPVNLRPTPTGHQNATERDPPTEAMIRFFLCAYCMEQRFELGSWPSVCVPHMHFVRACPRSLP